MTEIISARALRLALLLQRSRNSYGHVPEHESAWRRDWCALAHAIEGAGTPARTIEVLVDAAHIVQDAAGAIDADEISPVEGIEVEIWRDLTDELSANDRAAGYTLADYRRYACRAGAWRLVDSDPESQNPQAPRLWVGAAGYELSWKSLWRIGEPRHEARALSLADNLRAFNRAPDFSRAAPSAGQH